MGDADLIVVGDVERLGPAELQTVLDFHRAGGGLLLVPGGAPTSRLERSAGTLGAGTLARGRGAAGASWRLLRAVAGHAVLDGFPARPGEPLTQARFSRVPALQAPPARACCYASTSGTRHSSKPARVLVLAAPLDAARSDFALSGAFLPLVHQTARVLARGTAAPSLTPGDVWSAPASAEWRLEDETGRDVPVHLESGSGAARAVSSPLERPGLYRAYAGGKLRASFAVNAAASEGDLAPLPEAALVSAFPSGRVRLVRMGDDLAARIRQARFGRELWPEFVIAALALLVAESVIARWGMTGGGWKRS